MEKNNEKWIALNKKVNEHLTEDIKEDRKMLDDVMLILNSYITAGTIDIIATSTVIHTLRDRYYTKYPLKKPIVYDAGEAVASPTISYQNLEAELNRRWGTSQWDWTTGKCGGEEDTQWFWYCGTPANNPKGFSFNGIAPTLDAALKEMIRIHKQENGEN